MMPILSSVIALSLLGSTWFPAVSAWSRTPEQHVLLPPSPVVPGHSDGSDANLEPSNHEFSLRHIYHAGSHKYPGLLRKVDITPETVLMQDGDLSLHVSPATTLQVSSKPLYIQRMHDRSHVTVDSILEAGRMTGKAAYVLPEDWTMDEVKGPNVTDKKSVLSFAYMAANAYVVVPGTGDWEDVKGRFNYTEDFGWEEDGLRGHIFADTTNSTVVIGLKGTSLSVFEGETTGHDKENDNLFGSCCCAQGGSYFWKQVCDCKGSGFTCNNTCLTKSLREKSHYYHAAIDLYRNVTERYPGADVWLTGHSLGGVVTALLGLTYGLPAVTFEAFPDALAASRLGLPTPPGYHIGRHQERKNTGIYHFGHTADPVYMGICNAASAPCTIAGYSFESLCHTGNVCTYDTVGDLGWRVGIGTHRITAVIRDVLKKYDTVPGCEVEEDCVDCFKWKFFESNGTETTTSAPTNTATSKTSTRTATCQTPGWWGCLDETTSSTTTMTSTITTTTCLTPGWFGCKDASTTTQTTTIVTSVPAPAAPTITTIPITTPATTTSVSQTQSTTCSSKGWFGCRDPTASSTVVTPSSATMTKAPSSSTTCTSKEWFGLICVDPSSDFLTTTRKHPARTS